MNILKKADQIVNERSEEKERQYGNFIKCMERATRIYNSLTGADVSKNPSACMTVKNMYIAMIAMKFAREINSHKEDNLLDAAAYIGALNNYYLHEYYISLDEQVRNSQKD